jgi:hypothetical protein
MEWFDNAANNFWSGKTNSVGGTLGSIGSVGGNTLLNKLGIFGGGKDVEQPKPSAEETAIMQEILNGIREQDAWNAQMLPIQMEKMGMKWVYNDPRLNENLDAVKQSSKEAIEFYKQQRSAISQDVANSWSIGEAGKGLFGGVLDEYADGKTRSKEEWLSLLDTKIRANEDDLATMESGASVNNPEYGKWVEMTEGEYYDTLSPTEKLAFDTQKAQYENTLKATKGELGLSKTAQEQKKKEFENLKQVYGIEGDAVWDEEKGRYEINATGSDTIANENLKRFNEQWNALEEAQRFGKTSASLEGNLLAQGLTTGQTQNTIGTLGALGSGGAAVGSQYQNLLQPLMGYNQAGYQAQAQNQANRTAQTASLLGLLGYMVSSRKYKHNIKSKSGKDEDEALNKIRKTKSYEFEYKPMMGMPGKQLGGMAEEAPIEIKALNGKAISIPAKMEMMNMAIKSMARKVDRIEKRV